MAANNSQCPRCGNYFECGVISGEKTCWCFSMPKIQRKDNEEKCYCPACLERMTENIRDHSEKPS